MSTHNETDENGEVVRDSIGRFMEDSVNGTRYATSVYDTACTIGVLASSVARGHARDYTDAPICQDETESAEQLDNPFKYRHAQWEMNYQEAAIYLDEGNNNDKFETHPKNKRALPAYFVAHNKVFYAVDLLAGLALMLLAIVEPPALLPVPVAAHSATEIVCLLVLTIELVLKMRWLGPFRYLRHVRTMIKTVTLIIMVIEAIVVLSRDTSHFRVTRAIRPIFLVNSYHFRGVRRFIRHIVLCLPKILEMLVLVLFFMLIFTILGFYLFHEIKADTYFKSIQGSFISLFVLVTTANYPDVMMPAYNNNRISLAFFVAYLCIVLYFLMNLFLAVVYDSFTTLEKNKVKNLFLHRRRACNKGFNLLVSQKNPNSVALRHFSGLMKYYRPKFKRIDVYLLYKTLNTKKTGFLSLDEFYKIYYVCDLKWNIRKTKTLWSSRFPLPLKKCFYGIHWLINLKGFDIIIYAVIITNFVWFFVETIQISADPTKSVDDYKLTWYAVTFVCIYAVEAILRILGFGPREYFTSGWNVFDFLVVVASIIGVVIEHTSSAGFVFIIILRPFRMLRMFKISGRFYDVVGTFFLLLPRMISLAVSIILIYYFYSIIGMELFSQYDMTNCCENSSVATYYSYNNDSLTNGYYYLNNFGNIFSSAVTLFELTVINNWFIIMEGYAYMASEWSRIYFMIFYIIMMILMTVVVAFILEAFVFRIQYRKQVKCDVVGDDSAVNKEVYLYEEEVVMCRDPRAAYTSVHLRNPPIGRSNLQHGLIYEGRRSRHKLDFSLQMYADEVPDWILEQAAEDTQQDTELMNMADGSDEQLDHTSTSSVNLVQV